MAGDGAVRTVYVGSARLERWAVGFGSRHPGVRLNVRPDRVELWAPDGSTAMLHAVFGPLTPPSAQSATSATARSAAADHPEPSSAAALGQVAAALIADAYSVPVLRALLIRRGGYACAVVDGDLLRASKVGSRYVQGRTAAGGWSQQRFARRRAGQVHALVGSAIEVAARVLLPTGPDEALVTGGDRNLIEQVLSDPRLSPLRTLRTGPHLEIGDPRSDVLKELPGRARSIRIELDER